MALWDYLPPLSRLTIFVPKVLLARKNHGSPIAKAL